MTKPIVYDILASAVILFVYKLQIQFVLRNRGFWASKEVLALNLEVIIKKEISMSTRDYFKNVMLGLFFVILSLITIPAMWFFAKDLPFIFNYISPSFMAGMIIALAISCIFLFVIGNVILFSSVGKYVKLVSSNYRIQNHDQLVNSAEKLYEKIYDGRNFGYHQARQLLRSVYAVSRNPFLSVSDRKLKACFKIVKETCPHVHKIEVQTEFDVIEVREYLYIYYFVGADLKQTSILIAKLLYTKNQMTVR